MKHPVGLGLALVVCAAAEAVEPAPVVPAATVTPVKAVAKAEPEVSKPLDLRIRDVRNYMMPSEYREAIGAPDADQNTVVVEGNRELLQWKSDKPVPGGIFAPFWALAHPLQSWRILAPDLNAAPTGPPDKVPPPIFRWGP